MPPNHLRTFCQTISVNPIRSFQEIPSTDGFIPLLSTVSQLTKYFAKVSLFRLHEENREKYHKYGPIVRETYFYRQSIVQIFEPDDFEKVFRHQGKCPIRPPSEFVIKYRKQNSDLYSNVGLANLLGDEWLKQRSQVAPILLSSKIAKIYSSRLDEIALDFVNYLDHVSDKWGKVDDLLEATNRYALESIAMISLNSRMQCLSLKTPTVDGEKLIKLTRNMFEAFQELYHGFPLWKYAKTKSYTKFCDAEKSIYNLVIKYIQKVSNNSSDQCLLNMLLQLPDLDKKDVQTMILDFIAGGINTVSTSLCFLLHHLAANPNCQDKLYEEIVTIIGKKTSITQDHVNRLPYLKACLKESFRIACVIPNIVRILPETIPLSGYEVPAGIPIILNFDATCKKKEYFDEPDIFKPDRWLGESRKKIHPFSMFPFGLGSRMCAGRRLSELELWIATIRLIEKFKIVSETKSLKIRQHFILVPENKIQIRLLPRS